MTPGTYYHNICSLLACPSVCPAAKRASGRMVPATGKGGTGRSPA
ncbi:hypothetical protein DESPIG_03019 [Desulfovibrio piger ATCC 29098]|uniref:Uncharacterized protein n=1 Tax=Desulfovibrio piger ATCC 29098 TaxID=411464 RepID=B6WY43_9BACT|nr:hypothetical protein DESPIG_03019 [Desulfovibrio piger ATCC 29098]